MGGLPIQYMFQSACEVKTSWRAAKMLWAIGRTEQQPGYTNYIYS